jgi:transcriptional regulatory protein RtcR
MDSRPHVVVGLLGTTLDAGRSHDRWSGWRPTVSICMQPDFVVRRLELLHGQRDKTLAQRVTRDISAVSPETAVNLHEIEFGDPWDFERVYEALLSLREDTLLIRTTRNI